MGFEKNLILNNVLVAPLDWGLGHATRCIPIIKKLTEAGCTVIIAASGKTLALLSAEFPTLATVELFGYNIRYTAQKRLLPLKILWQSPNILLTIQKEQRWLKKLMRERAIDLVISDNRFGLHTNKIPCIFITHQLLIKAPFSWLERIIQLINYHFINKFSSCWVPDFKGAKTIASALSHPKHLPKVPVTYLGPLSRFAPLEKVPQKYDWLVVLSGPEPQRTILENKILLVAQHLTGAMLLVRGKPGNTNTLVAPANCTVLNHLSTSNMQQAFAESNIVVSRCGYTTVMEVLAQHKKAILIPTPGQTEQEYLAKHLFAQHWCYCCQQDDDLLFHFGQAHAFDYRLPVLSGSSLHTVIDELLF